MKRLHSITILTLLLLTVSCSGSEITLGAEDSTDGTFGKDDNSTAGEVIEIKISTEMLTELPLIEDIATELGVAPGHVYGVATFYPQLSLQPVGKHLIEVCVGAACHVAGAPLVLEAFSQEIEVAVGQTTGDMLFTLQAVNCVGACALAPVVRLPDGETLGHVTPTGARKLVRRLRRNEEA